MNENLEADVSLISRIDAVPSILDVVCKTTGMGFAAVARVTENRWIACGVRDEIAFGLKPGGELKVETTICNEIRDHRKAVVIDDVSADPVYASHHTPAMYGLQSYISMPIILPDGTFFGTLCAIDVTPHRLNTPEVIGMFTLFAELIAFHLQALQRVSISETDLQNERHSRELQEQFIAVLGHDLRNPLASIDAGARMLQRGAVDEKTGTILKLMQSSVNRMQGLIDNVLDFARGKLGGGIGVEQHDAVPIRPILENVVSELRSVNPDRVIESDLADVDLRCDQGRIGQLLSNLLANALTHGAAEEPVYVKSSRSDGQFELSVGNTGERIPQEIIDEMFKPFVRASANKTLQGLGLGLYIASEIAKAHNGVLSVTSSSEMTRFVFRMPLA